MPLSALEGTLLTWLREQLPLPADAGDISFDSPDPGWDATLTRPTVNLFLFDIARAAQPSVPLPPRRDPGGALTQERPAPRVSFSYLLSVWGGDVRQQHHLLGDAVRAVLRSPHLNPPADSPELAGPAQLNLSETHEVRARELWSGLGGRLRAGMVRVVTTGVPLGRPRPLAPPVETVRAEIRSRTPGDPARTMTGAGAERVSVAGSVAEKDAPRRFVWFGSRQQRGRGRP
jgi:hypothetical protein